MINLVAKSFESVSYASFLGLHQTWPLTSKLLTIF